MSTYNIITIVSAVLLTTLILIQTRGASLGAGLGGGGEVNTVRRGSDKSLHKKNFVRAASADGFEWARRLDRKQDVPAVIEEFLAFRGPAFLEVIIDPDAGVYPMVGPGLSYDAMITGDYIPARPPPSIVRLQSVIRCSIENPRTTEPVYSTT